MKESSYSYPTDLDYCGGTRPVLTVGHYGPVPEYTINGVTYPAASNVYHYHTQPVAPWTVGCYGTMLRVAAHARPGDNTGVMPVALQHLWDGKLGHVGNL